MQEKKRFEGVQKRTFEVEADGIRLVDEEKRIVELSFSSETPIKRYGAREILSHKKAAVMLERINTTGCLLFNDRRHRALVCRNCLFRRLLRQCMLVRVRLYFQRLQYRR